jgi:hypothetical protein
MLRLSVLVCLLSFLLRLYAMGAYLKGCNHCSV